MTAYFSYYIMDGNEQKLRKSVLISDLNNKIFSKLINYIYEFKFVDCGLCRQYGAI